jgi:hypothetical protein
MSMVDHTNETVRGVSLRQYAILVAGLADELPLADLLALTKVAAKVWPRAEEAWGTRMLDDLDADGLLADALEAQLSAARKLWRRPLPPLDTDLCAWLDFERAWMREVDGDAFLAKARMRQADIARLQDFWAERLRDDPAGQREALMILADEPGTPPVPAPEPARLIDEPQRRTG